MLERASKSRAVSEVIKNTDENVATDGFKDREKIKKVIEIVRQ